MNSNHKRWLKRVALFVLVVAGVVWSGNDLIRLIQGERNSVSHGSASSGSVERARRLPSSGPNFETYSRLGSLIGRTSVHHRVHDTILDAYAALHSSHPQQNWVFGESGWPGGGDFYPHRTHQNGLVVDFMTPVRRDSEPARIPTWPWTAWGYALDFDANGLSASKECILEIDFQAIAAHLLALQEAARSNGLRISKVILAPDLRRVMVRDHGTRKLRRLPFSKNPVWVRHDDHYHVEFELR